MMMIIKVSRSPLPSELFLVGRYCTGMDLHCTGYVAHRYLPMGYCTNILHCYIIYWVIALVYCSGYIVLVSFTDILQFFIALH